MAAESSLFIWGILVLDGKPIHIFNREMYLFTDNPWQGNLFLKCWLKLNGRNEDGVRHPSTELENDMEKTILMMLLFFFSTTRNVSQAVKKFSMEINS